MKSQEWQVLEKSIAANLNQKCFQGWETQSERKTEEDATEKIHLLPSTLMKSSKLIQINFTPLEIFSFTNFASLVSWEKINFILEFLRCAILLIISFEIRRNKLKDLTHSLQIRNGLKFMNSRVCVNWKILLFIPIYEVIMRKPHISMSQFCSPIKPYLLYPYEFYSPP